MIFNSLVFVGFAALFFPAYFLLRGAWRLGFTLAASYVFYGWWDWRFLGLLMLSTVMDYGIGLWLAHETDPRQRQRALVVSLTVNLGLLGFFKYANFFTESAVAAAAKLGIELSWPTLHILLPVGISFYVFQTLSYTIDVYRGECPPERSLLRFATFVALFPQLVAGPIVRASALLPQLRDDHPFDWSRTASGLELVAWGYFLKLVLADNIAHHIAIDDVYFVDPSMYGGVGHILAIFMFAFQIYGDFAGYSLIAIGLGRILGFEFGMNFRRPYFSASFSEFWRRWHISLSSWLRDYLYIPLGGNRHGRLNTLRNLFVTMVLGGLWHGAAWTLVIWGALHGAYLAIWHAVAAWAEQRRLSGRHWAVRGVLILLVFALTLLAWVFFRAASVADAWLIVSRITTLASDPALVTRNWVGTVKCLALIAAVLAVEAAAESGRIRSRYAASPSLRFAANAVIVWSIALLGSFAGSTFIYFQF